MKHVNGLYLIIDYNHNIIVLNIYKNANLFLYYNLYLILKMRKSLN